MLTEQGLLVRGDHGWVGAGDFEAVEIPPTISALLAARLDNLERSERSVIERASVVGKTFYRAAVTELSPVETRAEVSTGLMSLVRKELIRPERSSLMGDDSFQFRHLLIRDAAYAALPKRERAELHERFARWLQEAISGLGQFDEIVGYHLEHACQLRAELGLRDSKQVELAQAAADCLARAGRRTVELADLPAATGLLERAYNIAPVMDRPGIAADLGSLLLQAGRLQVALRITDEAAALSAGEPPLALLLTRAELRIERDGSSWEEATAEIEKLLPDIEAADTGLLIRALDMLSRVYSLQGSVSRGTEIMERALLRARESDDAVRMRRAASELAFYTVIGPTPVEEALARCRVLLTEAGEDQRTRASVLKTLSSLHALRGEFDEARRLAAESLAIMNDVGLRLAAARASVDFAMRELLAGDPLAAEAIAREGYETLDLMNERAYKCTCAALLAQALHLQGLQHEASRFAEVSRDNAGGSDAVGQYQWRTAQARVLAGRGQFPEAIALAKAAVELLEKTDLVFMHGDALFDLAGVLRTSGRLAEAEAAAREALRLHERKGARAAAELARDLADRIADEQHATA
jgi:tetratricopeptide (TPR) repeat protein